MRFSQVLANYLRLIRAQKNLIWFTNFFGQAAVVFPFLVAAPRYFSGAIQLGELMQISSAFGHVQDSLAWFVDNYSSLASWRATTDRLTSFDESLTAQSVQQGPRLSPAEGVLATDDLDLALPNGTQLLSHLSRRVNPGDSVLIKAQKNLIWFTTFFGQAAVIFPMIVAAPRYFSGAIQLGDLMKINSAFGRVQDSLSWFVDSYSSLAAWRATTDRLTSFDDAIAAAALDNAALVTTDSAAVDTRNLDIALPTGAVLLHGLNLHAQAGDRILLKGPSGSGKSTLFRTLAGIWPFASGAQARPADTMFIPQRPYFPNGTLREALAYPEPADRYADATMQQALRDALLPDLVSELDRTDAWGQKLSGGEQQRLAIARVLLKQPAWVFADEATSALDAEAENTLYERLQDMVAAKHGGMVSIAHRPSVAAFHSRSWELQALPKGAPARFDLKATALA